MDREQVFDEFMEMLYKISRKVYAYDSIPRKYGTNDLLYMVEAHTIKLIGKKEYIGVTDIANITGKTKGAVSQIVDKLVEKKVLVKEKDPEDNRRIKLSLTEKGQTIYKYHRQLDKRNYMLMLKHMNNISTDEFLICNKVFVNLEHANKIK